MLVEEGHLVVVVVELVGQLVALGLLLRLLLLFLRSSLLNIKYYNFIFQIEGKLKELIRKRRNKEGKRGKKGGKRYLTIGEFGKKFLKVALASFARFQPISFFGSVALFGVGVGVDNLVLIRFEDVKARGGAELDQIVSLNRKE